MEKLSATVLVIFGITGDLAQRKLLPALYHLEERGLLPVTFRIVGLSRRGTSVEDIINLIKKRLPGSDPKREQIYARLRKITSIVNMNIDMPDEYTKLIKALAVIEREEGRSLTKLFYLAIPANLFPTVTGRLGQGDINLRDQDRGECRFLIEKPFGSNLASAQELIAALNKNFNDSQIFRIDHYLAKETAQNILAFRFENPLFSGAWNKYHISHILVTAVESIGIEGRAAFYEKMGAMRDLFQSHLLQLLALVAMNRPVSMSSAEIHREKEKVLASIRCPSSKNMRSESVRGQYRTYRDETGIHDSNTETYAAVRLSIDTEEWRGVPVFIRTGKAIKEKVTEITVVFSDEKKTSRKNYLTLRIQPNEGIVIDLEIKKPGFDTAYEQVQLDFCYNDKLSATQNEAYERVLVDAMRGDRTLFPSSDEVLSCWRITEPILTAWADKDFPLYIYDNNSWGPSAADDMIAATGVAWLTDTHKVCTLRRIITPKKDS